MPTRCIWLVLGLGLGQGLGPGGLDAEAVYRSGEPQLAQPKAPKPILVGK